MILFICLAVFLGVRFGKRFRLEFLAKTLSVVREGEALENTCQLSIVLLAFASLFATLPTVGKRHESACPRYQTSAFVG